MIDYLVDRGVIAEPSEDSDYSVTTMARRHRNFAVLAPDGSGWFVKQGLSDEGRRALNREAEFYRRFPSDVHRSRLSDCVPRFVDFDPDRRVLTVNLVQKGRDARGHHTQVGRFPKWFGSTLGAVLGALHVARMPGPTGPSDAAYLPWVFSLAHPTVETFDELSPASVDTLSVVQQFGLAEGIEHASRGWGATSLIHGDLKWDNILVVPGRPGRLILIDWEHHLVGEPLWDVACIFADYLSFWLHSIPFSGHDAVVYAVSKSRYPVETMRPAIQSFWASYLDATQASRGGTTAGALNRCMIFVGVRLIAIAFEYAQLSSELPGNAVVLLQLAQNILEAPDNAAVHLLALRER